MFTWQSLLPVIELGANVSTSLLIPGGAAFVPLETALENAINPLLLSIGTKQTVTTEVGNFYATVIGILTTLQQVPGLPAETLAKVNEYLIAAQNGTAAYLAAQGGFNPAQFAPVAPIA